MNKVLVVIIGLVIMSCKEKEAKSLTAQNIVDHAIEVSGGSLYKTSELSFDFRNIRYELEYNGNQKVLKRVFKNELGKVTDVLSANSFKRYINDSLVKTPDTLAVKYSNSVNSVHYFAYLPYGLNDAAVQKQLLGEVRIKNADYYKVKVTFKQQGGGVDFDDIYIYWFNKETFKPDYLAYEYHVDGGGLRFREAYNERYIDGIRFVDYKNYKSIKEETSIYEIGSLFISDKLKLLSKIELENIKGIKGEN